MVVIRLARVGAKKRPFYHVVAIDSRKARNSGRFIERLGYFNPIAKGAESPLVLNIERIQQWQSQGAKASERVESLIKHFQLPDDQKTALQLKKENLKAKKAAAKNQPAPASEAAAS